MGQQRDLSGFATGTLEAWSGCFVLWVQLLSWTPYSKKAVSRDTAFFIARKKTSELQAKERLCLSLLGM